MTRIPISVAMAVLYQNQHFLMQLRDDKEDILYPGQWGLFGGHLEPAESPQIGLIREIREEINYLVSQPTLFRCYDQNKVNRYIFYAPLEVSIESLELNEGQDLDLVPFRSISVGHHYSRKAGQIRKLGAIHRLILLDFSNFARNHLSDFSA